MHSRLIRALVALVLVVVFAACGGGDPASSDTTTQATSTTAPAPDPTTTQPPATSTTTEAAGPFETQDITDIVEAARQTGGVPAMGGAVVTREGIYGIGVSGLRRVGTDTEVTLEDKWHLGSMLKAITGLLAGIAVEEGAIEWDTTIGEIYPDLTVSERWQDVTLSELLSMSSGMAAWADGMTGTTARQQRDSVVALAIVSDEQRPHGTFFYSNMAYAVAGSMIERAMGGDYEDLLIEKIAAPLGATGIGWGPQNTPGQTDQPVSHTPDGDGWQPQENWDNPPGYASAGRAHMPLGSWALIIQEFLRAWHGEGTLISEETAKYLFTGQVSDGTGHQYAIGWFTMFLPWDHDMARHNGTNLANHAIGVLGLNNGVAFLATTNAGQPDGTDGGAGASLLVDLQDWWRSNN